MSFPFPGTDTFDQTLVDAWWTQGWTAQNKAYKLAPALGTAPGAPSVTMVNVVHSYFDEDGSPLTGFLQFMPSASVSLTQNGTTYRMPARLSGTTTQGPYATGYGWHQESSGSIFLYRGQLYVSLMASDVPGLLADNNQPLTYMVTEHFDGGRQFSILVPGASSNPVDLDSLMIPGSLRPYVYDPTNIFANERSTEVVYPLNADILDIDGGTARDHLATIVIDGGRA